jgi:hypothetical protein
MRVVLVSLAAAIALLCSVKPVEACGYGMPSPVARFALADCVLVGKVINIEDRKVRLRPSPRGEPLPYTVAVFKVESMLLGDERVTHVRVALAQHQVMPVGYEGCVFLNLNPEEPIHVMASDIYDYPIPKENNPGFTQQIEQYRRMGRLLRDPIAALESKNDEDRYLTVALLLSRQRPQRMGRLLSPQGPEPLDGRTSKLILKTLAEIDWNRNGADFRLTPVRLFNMLGATPADGWRNDLPRTQQEHVVAARQWLKDHQDTFRIKTLVR